MFATVTRTGGAAGAVGKEAIATAGAPTPEHSLFLPATSTGPPRSSTLPPPPRARR